MDALLIPPPVRTAVYTLLQLDASVALVIEGPGGFNVQGKAF
jgi:hypothetical protein